MRKNLFLIILSFLFIIINAENQNIIREDELSATTLSPHESETQYVGNTYVNGGSYSITLTKTQKTSGSVEVIYGRYTYMDDGNEWEIGFVDPRVWDPDEVGSKHDDGTIFISSVQYYEGDVGSHTWTTKVYWSAREFTGTGWKYIGKNEVADTNNFTVARPGGCS